MCGFRSQQIQAVFSGHDVACNIMIHVHCPLFFTAVRSQRTMNITDIFGTWIEGLVCSAEIIACHVQNAIYLILAIFSIVTTNGP
jgi:hypothetical protein